MVGVAGLNEQEPTAEPWAKYNDEPCHQDGRANQKLRFFTPSTMLRTGSFRMTNGPGRISAFGLEPKSAAADFHRGSAPFGGPTVLLCLLPRPASRDAEASKTKQWCLSPRRPGQILFPDLLIGSNLSAAVTGPGRIRTYDQWIMSPLL